MLRIPLFEGKKMGLTCQSKRVERSSFETAYKQIKKMTLDFHTFNILLVGLMRSCAINIE
jgi:hypothetical protein